jgi:hypothetical protein
MHMAVITFDFDDTLTQTQWDHDDECFKFVGPNRQMITQLVSQIALGNEVHVVTSRMGPALDAHGDAAIAGQPAILPFLREHLGDNTERLAGVHWCGGMKRAKLTELGSIRHFDDDPVELANLPPGCSGVHVPTLHGID